MRLKIRKGYMLFSLCIVLIYALIMNQTIRETSLFPLPYNEIYRLSLFGILFLTVLAVFQSQAYLSRINTSRLQLNIVVIAVYLTLMNIILGNTVVDSITASSWCFALLLGLCLSEKNVLENGRLYVLLYLVLSVFVTMSLWKNYSGSIYRRTNIISINFLYYMGFPIYLRFKDGKNKAIEVALLVLLIILSILSFKRTSLIAFVPALFLYLWQRYWKHTGFRNKVWVVIVFIVLLVFVNTALNYTDSYVISRFQIISETGGNGRIETWQECIAQYSQSSILPKIFGHGSGSFARLYGISSHNDFLEYLYSFGIIGVIIYLTVIVYVFASLLRSKKICSYTYPTVLMAIVVFVIVSSFSHIIIYPYVSIPVFMFFGYMVGMIRKEVLERESVNDM